MPPQQRDAKLHADRNAGGTGLCANINPRVMLRAV